MVYIKFDKTYAFINNIKTPHIHIYTQTLSKYLNPFRQYAIVEVHNAF